MFKDVSIIIQIFDLVPLVLLSVFMPIPGCLQYCSSVVELEVWDCDESRSSFIVKDCFGYPGVFDFPYEVKYRSFKFYKEFCWDFDGNCIESVLEAISLLKIISGTITLGGLQGTPHP